MVWAGSLGVAIGALLVALQLAPHDGRGFDPSPWIFLASVAFALGSCVWRVRAFRPPPGAG